MGVDLGYINQKQAELAAAAAARSAGGFRYWNPSSGNNKIRLLPPWTDEAKSFERAIMTHFNVGPEEQMFPCAGVGCPICAHVAKMRATGDPADAEAAQRIVAKKRYYSNIIDMKDPVYTKKDVDDYRTSGATDPCPFEEGQTKVQIFGYGPMVYSQLINMFAQLQQDLTDPVNGYDIMITKIGEELATKYTVIPAPPARPVQISGRKKLSELLIDLDKINMPRSNEDMLAALTPQGAVAGGTAKQPPGLPPPATPPPVAALPPPTPPAPPAPSPQKAQTQPPAAEPPPPCFKDKVTFDQADVQCAGGDQTDPATKKTEHFEPCPFFQPCGEHSGKLVPPAAMKRRRTSAAAAAPATTEADMLEAQMREALKS